MTIALPTTQGIVDKVLDALVALFTLKLQTEISATDASRVTTIKVGPMQDDPTYIMVLVHENDPDDPPSWPHAPIRFREQERSGELVGIPRTFGVQGSNAMLRSSSGYSLVGGGGARMHRAFSAEIIVWGDSIHDEIRTLSRRDVGQLAAIVENRLTKAIREAGAQIGTGDAIQDDFGEIVHDGPYLGEYWTEQEEGESLIVRKRVRFYYQTFMEWNSG